MLNHEKNWNYDCLLTGTGKGNILIGTKLCETSPQKWGEELQKEFEMGYYFGKQDMQDLLSAQARCVLLTNGLGGYASVTSAGSVNRCDQGILVGAVSAPNERITMVHRLQEELTLGDKKTVLSTQAFADRKKAEEGYRHLAGFWWEDAPQWWYQVGAVAVRRQLYVARGINTAAVIYEIENHAEESCTLRVEPFLKFAPKEQALEEKK